nr:MULTISPECIES: restriction endonuclease subunit S [unclassified Enterococcus]
MNEVEWGTFTIQEIFNVVDGFYNKKPPMTNGNLPFLGATENNNGITGFTDIEIVKQWSKTGSSIDNTINNKTFGPNWLAVTNNGSVGNVYFMETTYTSSHDVTSLSLKNKTINKALGLFLSCILREAGKPFSYGRKWRPKRMRTTQIVLPLDKDKKPNWDYMEQYIVNIMQNIEVPELEPLKSSDTDLHSVHWKEFPIKTISEIIQSGHDWESYNRVTGSQPFIGSSALNNGITDYVDSSNREKYVGKNVIGVNRNGSVGYAFYHPYTAYFSGDTRFIKIADFSNNINVNLFITTMIMQQKDKYAYGYKMGTKRLSSQKIMLPVTNENIPDWQFMEDYIKSISNSKLI